MKFSFRLRIQPVDATVWLNISAVWKLRVFLGLPFMGLAAGRLLLAVVSLQDGVPLKTPVGGTMGPQEKAFDGGRRDLCWHDY